MKKIYLVLFICIAFLGVKSATFTVTILGNSYSPSTLTVSVGDMVVIQASGLHPANQVTFSDWTSGVTTPMVGGWGSLSTTFTFTATTVGTIYYLCQTHGPFGMKGTITVVSGVGINETANNFLNSYNLFPNPATSNVKVSFGLTENSTVNIKLFNVAGQEVKVFVSDLNLVADNYEYNFELPQSIASGNYFIEVSSGNRKSIKKLLVSK